MQSSFWASPATTAFIALFGVLIGVLIRDIIMARHLANQKRAAEVLDKVEEKAEERQDLVRAYADPLLEAATSLFYRLEEIVVKKQARFLRADAPQTEFIEYKKISTLYRIAVLLGWLRAIKRERTYLDPAETRRAEVDRLVEQIESALADGTHIEHHRLDELLILWRVEQIDKSVKERLANKIDGIRSEYLARKTTLSAVDLAEQDQKELAQSCANVVREFGSADIPDSLVDSCAIQAAVIFGIKEAYIYRDWQAAMGDFMLKKS